MVILRILKNITEDNHEISNLIKEAKKPLIIFGQSSLKSKTFKIYYSNLLNCF